MSAGGPRSLLVKLFSCYLEVLIGWEGRSSMPFRARAVPVSKGLRGECVYLTVKKNEEKNELDRGDLAGYRSRKRQMSDVPEMYYVLIVGVGM